jgi:hypothetical protein
MLNEKKEYLERLENNEKLSKERELLLEENSKKERYMLYVCIYIYIYILVYNIFVSYTYTYIYI